jgi:hypothetical protein
MRALAALIVLVLVGCTPTVRVTEVEKNRSHEFVFATDGSRWHLSGKLQIGARSYPAELVYNGTHSMIIREDPRQCISFAQPAKPLFGFAPANEGNGTAAGIAVEQTDEKGRPVRYRVVDGMQSSIVEIRNWEEEKSDSSEYSPNVQCTPGEEAYAIG